MYGWPAAACLYALPPACLPAALRQARCGNGAYWRRADAHWWDGAARRGAVHAKKDIVASTTPELGSNAHRAAVLNNVTGPGDQWR